MDSLRLHPRPEDPCLRVAGAGGAKYKNPGRNPRLNIFGFLIKYGMTLWRRRSDDG
jgi:hypothetical protein